MNFSFGEKSIIRFQPHRAILKFHIQTLPHSLRAPGDLGWIRREASAPCLMKRGCSSRLWRSETPAALI